MVNTARSFDFGRFGTLLEIEASSQDGKTPASAMGDTAVTVILDTSGSMGNQWVNGGCKAIANALKNIGFGNLSPVSVIEFNSNTRMIQAEVSDLYCGLGLRSGGGTYITEALTLASTTAQSSSEKSHLVIALSDGQIADRDSAVKAAAQLTKSGKTAMSGKSVAVLMVRAITSYYSDPDTRALACVGALATDGNQSVIEVKDVAALTESITTALKGCARGTATLTAPGVLFQRDVTDKEVAEVSLPLDQTSFVWTSKAPATITVGGTSIAVEAQGTVTSVTQVLKYTAQLEAQMRMWAVSGTRNEDMARCVAWAEELEAVVEAAARQSELNDADLTDEPISIKLRARTVVRDAKRRSGSFAQRLRELLNTDRVHNLNSQQQADFLRNVGDTRAGRRLARRTAKTGDETPTELAQQAVAKLDKMLRHAVSRDPEPEEVASFYSRATTLECLESAQELAAAGEALELSDVLQCVGGVGVPFKAHVADYPDPWAFRIQHMFVGESLSLAESDLWLMRTQSRDGSACLECPGHPGSTITGVLPLQAACGRDVYLMYARTKLFELQASAQMRHAVAPIPYDAIALNAAAAWHLLGQLGEAGSWTEAKDNTLAAVLTNLDTLIGGGKYKADAFVEHYDNLNRDDCRPWLTGDLGVSNVLFPVCALLRFGRQRGMGTNEKQLQHVLRALYVFEAYQLAKGACKHQDSADEHQESGMAARRIMLHAFLKIDTEANGVRPTPLFEADAPANQIDLPDELDLPAVEMPLWLPKIDAYRGLAQMLRNTTSATTTPQDIDIFGISVRTFRAVAAVQGLLCAHEVDRVDKETRISMLPDPATEAEAREYLNNAVRNEYEHDYLERLEAKRKEEEATRLEEHIKSLVSIANMEDFIRDLTAGPIQCPSDKGYEEVLAGIINSEATKLGCQKLAMLVTGRKAKDLNAVVWNKGNIVRRDLTTVMQYFVRATSPAFDGLRAMERLRVVVRTFQNLHKYRKMGPNRHGHSNEFPSYYALGFTSLDAMQKAVSKEEFAEYVCDHRARGCCGLR